MRARAKRITLRKLRIGFVHNAYIEYRTPLFTRLSQKYDVSFFFEWVDHSFYRSDRTLQPKIPLTLSFFNGTRRISPLLPFYLIRGKFDIFVCMGIGQINTYVTYLVSILLRKPLVYWDEQWYYPQTTIRLLVWPLLKSLVKNADAIVVPGSKARRFYTSIAPNEEQKIFVAPNVSLLPDSDYYRVLADKIREKLQLADKNVILYVGRIARAKGLEFLIEAFAKVKKDHRNAFLLVIGGAGGEGGEYSPGELDNLCKRLGLDDILFLGPVYGPKRTAYFILADMLVLPTYSSELRAEVWGLVVNEAMSVGKPVIATKAVGAASDLIKNGVNGFIVADRNPEALAKAINFVLENPAIKKQMGSQSLEIIRSGYTYDHMLKGFTEAIQYVLSSARFIRE